MSLADKATLLHGKLLGGSYIGNIPGNEALGIPPLNLNDGPQGFRSNDGAASCLFMHLHLHTGPLCMHSLAALRAPFRELHAVFLTPIHGQPHLHTHHHKFDTHAYVPIMPTRCHVSIRHALSF